MMKMELVMTELMVMEKNNEEDEEDDDFVDEYNN
jgi:hypothetical protein